MKVKAILLVALLSFSVSMLAQSGLPSSKATAQINTLVKCSTAGVQIDDTVPLKSCVDLFSGATLDTTFGWVTIMEKPIKLSASRSLFVSPSLVTGLYSQTQDKTAIGSSSTSEAMGGVYLRVVLVPADGSTPIVAAPISQCGALDPSPLGCTQIGPDWGVQLDTRVQTLTESLSACSAVVNSATGTCSLTSIVGFVLKTGSAHTFNFVFPNARQGTYTVRVQAAVGSYASIVGGGTSIGAAAFGLGSVTIESVRLVRDFQF
jgi:hypothetical protein